MPKRIQLSRARGFRLPEGTVKVARPTLWGNPYPVETYGRELALVLFGETARGCWSPRHVEHLSDESAQYVYRLHCEFGRRIRARYGCGPVEAARSVIGGRDVACWCRLDEACHGDIWIEIANEGMNPLHPKGGV